MRRYETVFIANSELTDEDRQSLLDKLQGLMPKDQAMLVKLDEWGNKRLAYEVKKQTRGYYVLMDYCGDGVLVKELERNMRLDDRVLKYMTVLKDTTVDLEAIKAEIEAAKAQAAQAEPVQETAGESATETADEPATETADEGATEATGETVQETAATPPTETADEPATPTAGEPVSESNEAAEAPVSEPATPEETPESSYQEEQEDETT
jgi:small subunit ribosomal protein S6